jgi:hypothetical protein
MTIEIALIVLLAILLCLVYLIVFRKVKQTRLTRLRRAQRMRSSSYGDINSSYNYENYERNLERYFIGDITCKYNAHSPYVRCAVNPCGPCDRCSFYEEKVKS